MPATLDITTPQQLARCAEYLRVPPEALRAAVAAVGNRLDDVKDYLTAGSAGSQQDG